jgi:hypothetical protein
MTISWSPYPRYRLYHSGAGYRSLLHGSPADALSRLEAEICRRFDARAAARNLILLPTYPSYPESEIQKNVNVIVQFLELSENSRPPPKFTLVDDISGRPASNARG